MRRNKITWDRRTGMREGLFYFNEDPGPHIGAIDWAKYDTFISHKGDDLNLAVQIGELLHVQDINGYLDHWDPAVDGDSPELEEYLRHVIRETPSILAVITERTTTSWWVPFEVGVARETDSVIATFLQINENRNYPRELPSYLKNWPILATRRELVDWGKELADSRIPSITGKSVFREQAVRMASGFPSAREIDRLERAGIVRFVS